MIYAGSESDALEPVDVSKLVEGMQGLLAVSVSRHAALVFDLGDGLPAVRARTAQLSQIVLNLVVNASEAIGDRDGVIRVTTKRTTIDDAQAIVKTVPAGAYVQLEVSDTGCGMSREIQGKVFDPFFSTKFSGRGLGLAVVQGIVRGLNGAIQITSESGAGTTVEVLLPCVETATKADTHPASAIADAAPPARRGTLLIVEDEEPLRLAVAKMLRKSGLEVLEAGTGSAAIELIRSRGIEIDVILLDLTIPGSTSQEVHAEAVQVRPAVKVILTSAYSEEIAKSTISSPLICGFIRKPFGLGDLVQTIQSVL
jgi:CheY-like chemotaxis protein/two-component sensor histidine kinase